jgi:membrane protease YdiL (CAAX protease family)
VTSAQRRTLAWETGLVLSIAVGLSAARSLLSFASAVSAPGGLAAQSATLVGTLAPGQPWIDLGRQLVVLAGLVLPVLLVVHLLRSSGESVAAIGLTRPQGRDVAVGLGLAAAVGGVGLAAYLVSRAAGLSVTVVPAALQGVWWRFGVLALSAAGNAALEEVVLVGYLLHRCRQLGWPDTRSAGVSAVVRGAYHLYQGLAGCLGNVVMGLLFARFYQRTSTILPLIVAHTMIDLVAFIGYSALAGHVGWLPTR